MHLLMVHTRPPSLLIALNPVALSESCDPQGECLLVATRGAGGCVCVCVCRDGNDPKWVGMAQGRGMCPPPPRGG